MSSKEEADFVANHLGPVIRELVPDLGHLVGGFTYIWIGLREHLNRKPSVFPSIMGLSGRKKILGINPLTI